MQNRNSQNGQQAERRVNTSCARRNANTTASTKGAYDHQTEPRPRQPRNTGEMQQVTLQGSKQSPSKKATAQKASEKVAPRRAKGKTMPRRLTRSEMRRRRRRRTAATVFLALVLIGVGLTLSVTVLFKVQELRVENLDKSVPAQTGIYSEDAILSMLEIPLGENLYQFSLKEKQQMAEQKLPYLETVRLRRRLPSTIVVQIEPAVETLSAYVQGGWLVLSQGLKIMKQQQEQPAGLPAIYGLILESTQPGIRLALKEGSLKQQSSQAQTDAASEQDELVTNSVQSETDTAGYTLQELQAILKTLQDEQLMEGVTRIDLTQTNEAFFVYENRIKVIVGTMNNLEYKMSVAGVLLRNESGEYISRSDRGTLNVSYQLEDGSIRPPFSPGEFTLPQIEDEPVQEP